MNVQLLQATKNPIILMWTAARTCYSSNVPENIWESCFRCEEKSTSEWNDDLIEKWQFVRKVLASGHLSIAEHVNFTFAISGISRACSHQLVRHRHCTFSQQSQRYVNLHNKMLDVVCPYQFQGYTSLYEPFSEHIKESKKAYDTLIEAGAQPEDARAILPNATCTNLIMTCNYAELIHICGLRMCTRAQAEIRQLFYAIEDEIRKQYIEGTLLSDLLKPKCDQNGFCDEHKSCGRYKIRRILNANGQVEFLATT